MADMLREVNVQSTAVPRNFNGFGEKRSILLCKNGRAYALLAHLAVKCSTVEVEGETVI